MAPNDDIPTWVKAGEEYAIAGQFEQASDTFARALKLDPANTSLPPISGGPQ